MFLINMPDAADFVTRVVATAAEIVEPDGVSPPDLLQINRPQSLTNRRHGGATTAKDVGAYSLGKLQSRQQITSAAEHWLRAWRIETGKRRILKIRSPRTSCRRRRSTRGLVRCLPRRSLSR